MKTLITSFVLSFILALPATTAAQTPQSTDTPDRADVLKFLEMMHVRAQMQQTLQGFTKQMREGAEAAFKQKVPNATPEQLAKLNRIFDGMFDPLPLDEMVDAIVPIYQKHLTKSDLAAIMEFYASPPGQKILKEMPAILAESMDAGGKIGQRIFAVKSAELDQRMDDLVKSSKTDEKAPPQ